MNEIKPEQLLQLKPIGFIRSQKILKFDTPHQPDRTSTEQSTVELIPGHGYREALRDLDGFEYIWLIWWFNKNPNWRPMVLPPRGNGKRRGVFATRSPHRPNPIGITVVQLIAVEKENIIIGSHDLLDGTPILDIKPYLISADTFPTARQGWIAELENEFSKRQEYQIRFSDLADNQRGWLKERKVEFIDRAMQLLQIDPTAHRTRRIKKCDNNKFRMSCGAWRIFYSLTDNLICIESFSPGYPKRLLITDEYDKVPFRNEQVEFLSIWPECES